MKRKMLYKALAGLSSIVLIGTFMGAIESEYFMDVLAAAISAAGLMFFSWMEVDS